VFERRRRETHLCAWNRKQIREDSRYDEVEGSIDPDAEELFDMLPNEIVSHIFSQLERKDLYK